MSATLIGVDEAGYGPNLGPLIVAATRWEVPEDAFDNEQGLESLLSPFVQRKPVGADPTKVAIADSKQLYSPGGGIGELERGVLSGLQIAYGQRIDNWRELWELAAPGSLDDLDAAPWRRAYNPSVPIKLDRNSLETIQTNLQANLVQAGVALIEFRAAAIFPARFNQLVAEHGNKASALSAISLDLMEALLPDHDTPTLVHCDKHGGRKKYGPLLQARFPDDLVLVRKEAPLESVYGLSGPRAKTRIRFVAKGDHFLPAALASMLAKYLREQAMAAFNAFWTKQVPGLKPTAGYPLDAKRFKREIADAQSRLQIDDHDLWRER